MSVLLVAIPLAFAFATIPFPKLAKYILPLVLILNIALLFTVVKERTVVEIGNWDSLFGISFVVDQASYNVSLIVNVLMLITTLIFITVLEDKYFSVLLILTSALNGIIFTGDFFNSFVWLEIIGISAYILAQHKENYYGAFKYLIFGGLAGSFYLIGAVLVYIKTGTLNMGYAAYIINPEVLNIVSFFLIVGLLTEIKLLPFGLWAPDVYSNGSAMTPIVLVSAVNLSTFYLFLRFTKGFFDGSWYNLIYLLAIVTILFGQLGALYNTFRKNIRKVLAFMALAQAGVVLGAIASNVLDILSPSIFHLMNVITAEIVLFTVIAFVSKGFKSNKTAGIAFTLASLSAIGVPPFAGFWSKFYILKSLFESGNYILPAVILFGTLLEAGYLIKWNVDLWFEEADEEESALPFSSQMIVLLLALALILVGVFPNLYLQFADKIATVEDFGSYFNLVLSKGGM